MGIDRKSDFCLTQAAASTVFNLGKLAMTAIGRGQVAEAIGEFSEKIAGRFGSHVIREKIRLQLGQNMRRAQQSRRW